jgi:hypothetical protein
MEPGNRFQRMNSVSLSSLAGRYDNPIPTRFLAHIDCLKIPAQYNEECNIKRPKVYREVTLIGVRPKTAGRKEGGEMYLSCEKRLILALGLLSGKVTVYCQFQQLLYSIYYLYSNS